MSKAIKIVFEPAVEAKPKQGRKKAVGAIRSRYTADGSFPKRRQDMPTVTNVGELKALLAQMPDELPLRTGMGGGLVPVWYNVGMNSEHVEFQEAEEGDFDFEDDDL